MNKNDIGNSSNKVCKKLTHGGKLVLYKQNKLFLVTVILILLLVFLAVTVGAQKDKIAESTGMELRSAPINPAFEEWQKYHHVEMMFTEQGNPLGYIPPPFQRYREDVPEVLRSADQPDQFDLRKEGRLTEVRDQKDLNSCWAFASYASLESYLLPGSRNNFSENNLMRLHGFDLAPSEGGNDLMSIAYLARWSGPVDEAKDPYLSYPANPDLPPEKHVQQVRFINESTADIKQALMDNGALFTAMHWSDDFFNKNTNAFYCPDKDKRPNHGVAIVGWDDNFDRNNFNEKPPGNGAWIIRNSWGSDWGDDGYFYLSYSDTLARALTTAFHNAEPTDNYSRIYQYDHLGWIDSAGFPNYDHIHAANIFEATSSGYLLAVGTYAVMPGTNYEIRIHTGVRSGKPESGTLALTQSGTMEWAGYHTIPLDHAVNLRVGQQFSVIIRYNTPKHSFPVPIEIAFANYSSRATANRGESFYRLDDASEWHDLYLTYNKTANFCIKAFTEYFTFTDVIPPMQFFDYIEAVYTEGITTGYNDGSYRPDEPVTRGQLAAFLARALKLNDTGDPNHPSFTDVKPAMQFFGYIEAIYAEGITTGYSDGSYRPNDPVNREQMAAFLARALELTKTDDPDKSSFSDVLVGMQFFSYIEAIYAEEITTGYGDGTYRPGDTVTRGQMAAFLARALDLHH